MQAGSCMKAATTTPQRSGRTSLRNSLLVITGPRPPVGTNAVPQAARTITYQGSLASAILLAAVTETVAPTSVFATVAAAVINVSTRASNAALGAILGNRAVAICIATEALRCVASIMDLLVPLKVSAAEAGKGRSVAATCTATTTAVRIVVFITTGDLHLPPRGRRLARALHRRVRVLRSASGVPDA